MEQVDPPTLYFVVSTAAFIALAVVVPLTAPQVLRPGGVALLAVIAVAVVIVAVVAVRWSRRSGHAPVWWAYWSSAVVFVTGCVVVDPGVRTLIAVSVIAGPVYGAMFMPLRRGVGLTIVAGILMSLLIISVEGPWPVRVVRVAASLAATGTLISGLLILRYRLDRERELADESSRRDPLTGLLNRRGIHHHLPDLLDRAGAQGHGVMVAVADIDRFKSVNDTFGHAVGDVVLAAVAQAVSQSSRGGDLIGRLGGEELIWVAAVNPGEVTALAEHLRSAVEDAGTEPAVTVSVGAAWSPTKGWRDDTDPLKDRASAAEDFLRALFQRADVLLYAAKAAGRNRALSET